MAHLHEVKDNDVLFALDEKLNITCEGTPKELKRGDHAAEIFSFVMPRYFEGHDMSTCNKVEVHYNNINPDKYDPKENRSFDEVQNFRVLEEDENKIAFDWLVQGDATELDGILNFCIYFACMNGDVAEYKKFSGIYKDLTVGENIYNTEEVARKYADVLAAWKAELEEKIANAGEVKTVNNVEADKNGNVDIVPSIEETAMDLLIQMELAPVVLDHDGAVLADADGAILLST